MQNKAGFLIVLALSFALSSGQIACAGGKGRVPIDSITQSSAKDGDATALIEGCGNPPVVGFTYCRIQEGSSSTQNIWFIGPPAECDRSDACVFIKVYDTQGHVAWGGAIPKGKTRVPVSWTTLLSGSPTFEVNHRGTWTWNETVYWKDTQGRERVSTAQGDLILRTFRSSYIPLHEVGADPNFVWEWVENNCEYKVTSGLRANVKCGISSHQ